MLIGDDPAELRAHEREHVTMSNPLSQLATRVRTLPADEDFDFAPDTVQLASGPPEARGLAIMKGDHWYPHGFHVESVQFFARKQQLAELALLLIHAAFKLSDSEGDDVFVSVSHPRSVAKRIRITTGNNPDCAVTGIRSAMTHLRYQPSTVKRHPFPPRIDADFLPGFGLTDIDDLAPFPAPRDVAVIFGNHFALASLAAALLDLSREDSTLDEIELEVEGGFRGVTSWSSEARFCLPGSNSWDAASLTDL